LSLLTLCFGRFSARWQIGDRQHQLDKQSSQLFIRFSFLNFWVKNQYSTSFVFNMLVTVVEVMKFFFLFLRNSNSPMIEVTLFYFSCSFIFEPNLNENIISWVPKPLHYDATRGKSTFWIINKAILNHKETFKFASLFDFSV
jgi:hypothetical protein